MLMSAVIKEVPDYTAHDFGHLCLWGGGGGGGGLGGADHWVNRECYVV